MENLPADIQRQIALELKPSELIRLCATNKLLYRNICDDDGFWRIKLLKDFPHLEQFYSKGLPLKNPKKTYIREFTLVSKFLETELSKSDLSPEMKERLYKILENFQGESREIGDYIPELDKDMQIKIKAILDRVISKRNRDNLNPKYSYRN